MLYKQRAWCLCIYKFIWNVDNYHFDEWKVPETLITIFSERPKSLRHIFTCLSKHFTKALYWWLCDVSRSPSAGRLTLFSNYVRFSLSFSHSEQQPISIFDQRAATEREERFFSLEMFPSFCQHLKFAHNSQHRAWWPAEKDVMEKLVNFSEFFRCIKIKFVVIACRDVWHYFLLQREANFF